MFVDWCCAACLKELKEFQKKEKEKRFWILVNWGFSKRRITIKINKQSIITISSVERFRNILVWGRTVCLLHMLSKDCFGKNLH